MNRHALFNAAVVLGISSVLAAPAALAEGPIDGTLYGRINLTLDNIDFDAPGSVADYDVWELNSNASRIGVKGGSDLNDDLRVVYQFEWEVSTDGSDTDMKPRNRYIGLESDSWGRVIGGRHDTPVKLAQMKVDLFNDLPGDIKNTFEGENRSPNIVMYTSPLIGAVTISGAFIPGEDISNAPGADDGLADGISASVNFTAGDFTGAVAIDQDVDGQDLIRAVGQFKLNDFTFGAMVQQNDNDTNTVDETGFFVSASMSVSPWVFKAQMGVVESDVQGVEGEQTISVGADYKLGKNTKFLSYLTLNQDDFGNAGDIDERVLGVGFEHRF